MKAKMSNSDIDWLRRMDNEVEAVAHSMRPKRPVKRSTGRWPKAPLRKIVARYPEGFVVREMLECGHWHTHYEFGSGNASKRRRCHGCQQGRPKGTEL